LVFCFLFLQFQLQLSHWDMSNFWTFRSFGALFKFKRVFTFWLFVEPNYQQLIFWTRFFKFYRFFFFEIQICVVKIYLWGERLNVLMVFYCELRSWQIVQIRLMNCLLSEVRNYRHFLKRFFELGLDFYVDSVGRNFIFPERWIASGWNTIDQRILGQVYSRCRSSMKQARWKQHRHWRLSCIVETFVNHQSLLLFDQVLELLDLHLLLLLKKLVLQLQEVIRWLRPIRRWRSWEELERKTWLSLWWLIFRQVKQLLLQSLNELLLRLELRLHVVMQHTHLLLGHRLAGFLLQIYKLRAWLWHRRAWTPAQYHLRLLLNRRPPFFSIFKNLLLLNQLLLFKLFEFLLKLKVFNFKIVIRACVKI